MTFRPDATPPSITAGKSIEPSATTPKSPQDFSSLMQGSSNQMGTQTGATSGPSPINIPQGPSLQTGTPTMDTIQAQARNAQDSLGVVGNQLNDQNLKLKRSQAHLLKNKLTNAQTYIRQSAEKMGVQQQPFTTPNGATAIGRFIAYVNDGQNQLVQVQQQLKQMSAKGQQLNAAQMLTVTVKMNLAQQEIDYSTTLLGKIMDSIKQIMNTQL